MKGICVYLFSYNIGFSLMLLFWEDQKGLLDGSCLYLIFVFVFLGSVYCFCLGR